MGIGQRVIKKPNHFNHSDKEETNNDEKNSRSDCKKKLKVYGRKKVNVCINEKESESNFMQNEQNIDKALPVWPAEIQSSQNNANIIKFVTHNNQNNGKFLFYFVF